MIRQLDALRLPSPGHVGMIFRNLNVKWFLGCQLVLQRKIQSWCCPKDNTISNATLDEENLRLLLLSFQ